MIDSLKEKIEDIFIHIEELSGNKPSIGEFFMISKQDGEFVSSHRSIYDLVKDTNSNSEFNLSYCLWVEIVKPVVQKYNDWMIWNTTLNTAIIRMGYSKDSVKITNDGNRQIIEAIGTQFKVNNFLKLAYACRFFNSRNEYAHRNKISISPEYNPVTGIEIYARESPHKDYKRGEYFEKALKDKYYDHKTNDKYGDEEVEIIQKIVTNTSIESLFTVEKVYKEGEIYKENSYLCKNNYQDLNSYIIAKLRLK